MAIIDKPSDYFNTVLYTGNGSTQSITGVGFQPDWVWQKTRNYDYSHSLVDVVRGASLNIFTNNTLADQTVTNGLTSFDSDGFSVGADLGWNASASDRNSKVAWNWLASNTTASNTQGDITSTVSANTTSGFSIVSYTGTGSTATVGHGLGATPSMIIIKERNNATSWIVYHHKNTSAPATDYLLLNSTQATDDYADYFNDTEPTSSVFTIDTAGDINGSSDTYIAYCFAEKKGFSKFGSYTGNGNADGTFVYTGFKPAFVIRKVTSASSDWIMQDNKRSESGGSNQIRNYLFPNSSQAEVSSQDYFNIDFLSNGFKMRSTDGGANGSGQTYIYMAFAENPFVTSTGIPTTAR